MKRSTRRIQVNIVLRFAVKASPPKDMPGIREFKSLLGKFLTEMSAENDPPFLETQPELSQRIRSRKPFKGHVGILPTYLKMSRQIWSSTMELHTEVFISPAFPMFTLDLHCVKSKASAFRSNLEGVLPAAARANGTPFSAPAFHCDVPGLSRDAEHRPGATEVSVQAARHSL